MAKKKIVTVALDDNDYNKVVTIQREYLINDNETISKAEIIRRLAFGDGDNKHLTTNVPTLANDTISEKVTEDSDQNSDIWDDLII